MYLNYFKLIFLISFQLNPYFNNIILVINIFLLLYTLPTFNILYDNHFDLNLLKF